MKRFTKKLISLLTVLIFFVELFTLSPIYAAQEFIPEISDKEVLAPVDGIDYEGHTYVLFDKWFTWPDAKAFCEQYGGHLVCFETVEEQMAIMKQGWEGWTGARLQGAGWTQAWVWDFDGSMLGTMHEPVPGVKGDFFNYAPSKPYLWDARTKEPNSWKSPFDQSVARLETSYGLNTIMPSDFGKIICEFETLRSFVFVDNNYDRDDDYNTDKSFNTELLVNPDNYQVVGTYLVPRAIELDKAVSGQSLLKKQDFGKYPVHVDKHYNFLGWSYKTADGTLARWDYASKDPMTKGAADYPIIVLYADWEDARDFKQTDDAESAAVYLALDQLVYLISDNEFNSSVNYNGVNVGEFLNYCKGKEFDKLKPKLPLLVKNGDRKDDRNVINMLDYLYAKIGGWTILDSRAGEKAKGGGWSFFAAAATNYNGINAVIYEGTAFEPSAFGRDSFGTDAKFGIFGEFNSQFRYALEFFRDISRKYSGETFATGHSLGGGLAAHAAVTLNARAHTFNGVEGWTLPLTIRQNAYTRDFHGIDELSSVDSWIQMADFAVGRHEYDNRAHNEISVPGIPNLSTAHLVSSCIMYTDGRFSIAPSVHKPAPQRVWEIKNTYLGTSGNDTFRQPNTGVFNKPFFFGGDGNDVVRTDLAQETGATFIPGAGNNTLCGDTGPNTYIIKRNPNGGVSITDPYALSPNNRIELVNLRVTGIQENVDMLLSDGRASKGVCITTDDKQHILMDTMTLKNCTVFLVNAPDSVIWGAQPTFKKIYPLNGKWDKGIRSATPTPSKVLLNK